MVSETTSPKYICYCDEVTEDDIVAAMRAGADTVDKVIAATGAMTHCDCKNKIPKAPDAAVI